MRYLLLFLIPALSFGQQLAFPTAEGFGKYTSGGRGKNVYVVTNTNGDTSTGSIRWAVNQAEANGGGNVVFATGGRFNLQDFILIDTDNITIAGETAPTAVALFADWSADRRLFDIRASNIIIRYVTIRMETQTSTGSDGISIRGINGENVSDVIIDHVSISWFSDEQISAVSGSTTGGTLRDVTIQNSLFGEALNVSGYGALMQWDVKNISWYRNMFNDCLDRNPRASSSGIDFEVINCVKYNTDKPNNVSYGDNSDWIGNVFKWGTDQSTQPLDSSHFRYVSSSNTPAAVPGDGKVYEDDTILTGDNTGQPLTNTAWDTSDTGSKVLTGSLITALAATTVADTIIDNVGNNLFRDILDQRLIDNFENGTGAHVSTVAGSGTMPTYPVGTTPADTEFGGAGDGMWDVAEIAVFGSIDYTNNPSADHNGDGYTNLEETFFYFTGETAAEEGEPILPDGRTKSYQLRGAGGRLKIIVE